MAQNAANWTKDKKGTLTYVGKGPTPATTGAEQKALRAQIGKPTTTVTKHAGTPGPEAPSPTGTFSQHPGRANQPRPITGGGLAGPPPGSPGGPKRGSPEAKAWTSQNYVKTPKGEVIYVGGGTPPMLDAGQVRFIQGHAGQQAKADAGGYHTGPGSDKLKGTLDQIPHQALTDWYLQNAPDKVTDLARLYTEGPQGLSGQSQTNLIRALQDLTGETNETMNHGALGLPKPKPHSGSFFGNLGHNLNPTNWRPGDFFAESMIPGFGSFPFESAKAAATSSGIDLPGFLGAGAHGTASSLHPHLPDDVVHPHGAAPKKSEGGGGGAGGGGSGGGSPQRFDLNSILSAFSPPALNQFPLFYNPQAQVPLDTGGQQALASMMGIQQPQAMGMNLVPGQRGYGMPPSSLTTPYVKQNTYGYIQPVIGTEFWQNALRK